MAHLPPLRIQIPKGGAALWTAEVKKNDIC